MKKIFLILFFSILGFMKAQGNNKYDKNGNLESVEYSHFTIAEKPQNTYIGYYQNGKKFEGYFLTEKLLDEIKNVDFYEKGILKYRYSFDFIKQMENYDHYTYDIKTDFIDGKVFNGYEEKMLGTSFFLRKRYEKSKINLLELNMFAMHYFNRLSFELQHSVLKVSDFEYKSYLTVRENAGFLELELFDNDGELLKRFSNKALIVGSPSTFTLYYLDQNIIKESVFQPLNLDINEQDFSKFLLSITMKIINTNFKTVRDVLDFYSKNLSDENKLENILSGDEDFFKSIISNLSYDSKGQPNVGIRILQRNQTYVLEKFDNGKKTESIKVNSVNELKSEIERLNKN